MSDMREIKALSWAILEARAAYYYPHLVHPDRLASAPTDAAYDATERRYRELCQLHGVAPTASEGIELNFARPCVALVMRKMASPPPKSKEKTQLDLWCIEK
jgi:hypothetical protein